MPSENTVNCHIKDGVNYSGFNIIQEGGGGGGTSGQVISYAEWLQLTPEEQNNGEYYIPDFPTEAITPNGGFDTEPKLGSIKPVTSDGIARAMRVDTNPIGTVLALMGLTAPYGYLICDGTTYQIEDYPELADYFADQFGSVNKFGGNGTTTFAVPDLRGEFLRGTGTNSHANQGNGANVGVHQDGTEHINSRYMYSSNKGHEYIPFKSYGNIEVSNPETILRTTGTAPFYTGSDITVGTAQTEYAYTSRPTNTSVNFVIKAVNSPASAQQQLDMHNRYSTEETWTGKYWIDGKKIYVRVYTDIAIPNTGFNLIVVDSTRTRSNTELIWATAKRKVGTSGYNYDDVISTAVEVTNGQMGQQVGPLSLGTNGIVCEVNAQSTGCKLTAICFYTKTTD